MSMSGGSAKGNRDSDAEIEDLGKPQTEGRVDMKKGNSEERVKESLFPEDLVVSADPQSSHASGEEEDEEVSSLDGPRGDTGSDGSASSGTAVKQASQEPDDERNEPLFVGGPAALGIASPCWVTGACREPSAQSGLQ